MVVRGIIQGPDLSLGFGEDWFKILRAKAEQLKILEIHNFKRQSSTSTIYVCTIAERCGFLFDGI